MIANILMNMRGVHPTFSPTLVLTDFGLARITDQNAITVTGHQFSQAVGISCRYAAPEVWQAIYQDHKHTVSSNADQAEPVPKLQTDPKMADIYAFAIVLWELLHRSVPWKELGNEAIRIFFFSFFFFSTFRVLI
jgi:serine/threonine protein kinase